MAIRDIDGSPHFILCIIIITYDSHNAIEDKKGRLHCQWHRFTTPKLIRACAGHEILNAAGTTPITQFLIGECQLQDTDGYTIKKLLSQQPVLTPILASI